MKHILLLFFSLIFVACTQDVPKPISTAAETQAETANEIETTGASVSDTEIASTSNDTIVAIVNDQPILLKTYQKQIAQFEQTLQAQGTDLESETGQAALRQINNQVLDALIDQVLIEQAASEQGISIAEDVLAEKIRESVEQGGGEAQFETWLEANSLTNEEFRDTLRFQLTANQMFEVITQDIPDTAEQIQLRQIVVTTDETARSIIDQLKAGVDFGELAQEYTIDESNRESGGALDWFPRGAGLVPPEIEDIAFSLNPDEVSGPIQSPLGFHIIQLQNREENRSLKTEMLQALKDQFFTNWLREQRAASVIEKFVDQ